MEGQQPNNQQQQQQHPNQGNSQDLQQKVQQQQQQKPLNNNTKELKQKVTENLRQQIESLFKLEEFFKNKYLIEHCTNDFQISFGTILYEHSIQALREEIKPLPIQRQCLEKALEECTNLKKINGLIYQVQNIKNQRTQIEVSTQRHSKDILEIIKKFPDFENNFTLQQREKNKVFIFGNNSENTIKMFDYLFEQKLQQGDRINAVIANTDNYSKVYYDLFNQLPDGRNLKSFTDHLNQGTVFLEQCDIQQFEYNNRTQQMKRQQYPQNYNGQINNYNYNNMRQQQPMYNQNRQGQRQPYQNGGGKFQGKQNNVPDRRNNVQQKPIELKPQEFPSLGEQLSNENEIQQQRQ